MGENRQIYPIGVQSFRIVRENGSLYVDKTQYIPKLLRGESNYCFLSRPRRFGKSLLISMLEEYFKGNRALFKGLAIDTIQPEQWPEHPVLHLDFNAGSYNEENGLGQYLSQQLTDWELLYGGSTVDRTLKGRFLAVIKNARQKTGNKVVILIDEYDKPILDLIDSPERMEENRITLKNFYEGMKSAQEDLRFVMLTGVGKIGNINIFSGLNNIRDLSMSEDFSGICGITKDELHSCLDPGVQAFADKRNLTLEDTYDILKEYYDGYHFSEDMLDVYNPYSLLNALADKKLGEYWSWTGTPSSLIKQLRHAEFPITDLDGCKCSADELLKGNVLEHQILPTLYYTGYLTIKGFDWDSQDYTLGFPNKEVRTSFAKYLVPTLTHLSNDMTSRLGRSLKSALADNDLEEFFRVMRVYYSKFDYDLAESNEGHYQDIFYAACLMVAPEVRAEYKTAAGRIDLCLGTKTRIYIVEFKICDHPDQAPKKIEEAFEQIERKQYDLPFQLDGRRIVKLAVVFDRDSRNIAAWEAR